MPIPALNSHGFLPAGVHACTLAEIGARFSRKDGRHARAVLFRNLEAFAAWVKTANGFTHLYVDGSFITDKLIPGDIDAVLELPTVGASTLARLAAMKISISGT